MRSDILSAIIMIAALMSAVTMRVAKTGEAFLVDRLDSRALFEDGENCTRWTRFGCAVIAAAPMTADSIALADESGGYECAC
jgi:hypothetical protein